MDYKKKHIYRIGNPEDKPKDLLQQKEELQDELLEHFKDKPLPDINNFVVK
jgi:hypothetical protein